MIHPNVITNSIFAAIALLALWIPNQFISGFVTGIFTTLLVVNTVGRWQAKKAVKNIDDLLNQYRKF